MAGVVELNAVELIEDVRIVASIMGMTFMREKSVMACLGGYADFGRTAPGLAL